MKAQAIGGSVIVTFYLLKAPIFFFSKINHYQHKMNLSIATIPIIMNQIYKLIDETIHK